NAAATRCRHRACLSGRPDRDQRRASLFRRLSGGHAFPSAVVHHGRSPRMAGGSVVRGWARSARSVWPAIVVISLLWAALHVQYDWTGILQIFVVGLFLGW